ncbi:POK18 protein, partial [Glaucidium brasilianum]|nr:POK18 protein [Glaucidium brasilianum]
MRALQPGLPNPAMIPEGWHLLIIDLKDCFFMIRNDQADQLVSMAAPVSDFIKARESHDTFHQNARGLHHQFNITMEEARGIVGACATCGHHGPGLG